LSLVFRVNDLFDSRALFATCFLDPVHHRHDGRMLFAQALHELDQECVWEIFRFPSARSERHDVRRLQRSELEQLVGELVGFVALGAARAMAIARRRRFSTSASRKVMATAHSSPIESGATV
jgi:hypothetical protein